MRLRSQMLFELTVLPSHLAAKTSVGGYTKLRYGVADSGLTDHYVSDFEVTNRMTYKGAWNKATRLRYPWLIAPVIEFIPSRESSINESRGDYPRWLNCCLSRLAKSARCERLYVASSSRVG